MDLLETILKDLLVKQVGDGEFLKLFTDQVAATKALDDLEVEEIAEALEKMNLMDHNIPIAMAAAFRTNDEKLEEYNFGLNLVRQKRMFAAVADAIHKLRN